MREPLFSVDNEHRIVTHIVGFDELSITMLLLGHTRPRKIPGCSESVYNYLKAEVGRPSHEINTVAMEGFVCTRVGRG